MGLGTAAPYLHRAVSLAPDLVNVLRTLGLAPPGFLSRPIALHPIVLPLSRLLLGPPTCPVLTSRSFRLCTDSSNRPTPNLPLNSSTRRLFRCGIGTLLIWGFEEILYSVKQTKKKGGGRFICNLEVHPGMSYHLEISTVLGESPGNFHILMVWYQDAICVLPGTPLSLTVPQYFPGLPLPCLLVASLSTVLGR